MTLGTGEGGNASATFLHRGFDARNDIFVDGVRDPGVSIRENSITEQVEILRGPGSSFAGRGTAGGAINIVTKQAGTRIQRCQISGRHGPNQAHHGRRQQVISPTCPCARRLPAGREVAGRDYVATIATGRPPRSNGSRSTLQGHRRIYIRTGFERDSGFRRAILSPRIDKRGRAVHLSRHCPTR